VTALLRLSGVWFGVLALTAAACATSSVLVLTGGSSSPDLARATVLAAPQSRPTHATSTAAASGRPAARAITLEWVGDMAMSTQLGLPPGGVAHALAPLGATLRGADLTLGNLEGTLSVGGSSKCGPSGDSATCFAFQAPPVTAFGLRHLGFDLVNQANNHAQDFGASGHAQTLAALRHAGLHWTGDPGEITYLTTHGVRVAFLGFAPYTSTANLLDIPAAKALVRRAARHVRLIVVIIHAGAEGADQTHTPRGTQYFLGEDRGNARLFAHAVIHAGASVVLGSGPHVIRGVQRDRGHLIAYSLGNFIGYHTLGGGGVLNDSGILRVALDPSTATVTAARWIPIELDSGIPRRAPGTGDIGLVNHLSHEDFPNSHFTIKPNGRFAFSRGRRGHR
jgi:poly-gamma-glutamate capsule biosynthesis protein CapA/YwtB (metallophosphatase superfamily)